MMFDKVEIIGKSLVQHGPNNDRAYLMKLHPDDLGYIEDQLYKLSILKRYSKIFAIVPEWGIDAFLKTDFKIEASIPGLYKGKTRGYFVAQYFNAARSYLSKKDKKLINTIKDAALEIYDASKFDLPPEYRIEQLDPGRVDAISRIYKKTFKVYPFPIFKKSYLEDKMKKNTHYYGVFNKEDLAAVSSSEIDPENKNAEMTDFATEPDHRGRNLSYFLLQKMMSEMKKKGIKTVYTIARAKSHGMNKTFGRSGFQFGGTLINNTNIGQSIETMNVWYLNL